MKKSDWVVFAIFDFIYLIMSCLLAKLVSELVLWMIDRFVVLSYHDSAVISAVTLAVVSVVLVGVLTYRDGYRYATFRLTSSLLSAGAASLLHFAIGLVTRFAPVLFGPTRHIAGLASYGSFYNSAARAKEIPFGMLAVWGLVMLLVYAAVMLLMNLVGCRKRLRDRAKTMGAD